MFKVKLDKKENKRGGRMNKIELQEENNILKLKLADLEVKNYKLQKELNTVIELYENLVKQCK